MLMLNKVLLCGRIVADPEFRQTTSGISCCKFRMAINRPYRKDQQEQQADFISVICWRQTAEFVSRYFFKGNGIFVEGSMQNNDYTDSNGVKRYQIQVLAERVAFAESKGSAANVSTQVQTAEPPRTEAQEPTEAYAPTLDDIGEFAEILSDGEVPF